MPRQTSEVSAPPATRMAAMLLKAPISLAGPARPRSAITSPMPITEPSWRTAWLMALPRASLPVEGRGRQRHSAKAGRGRHRCRSPGSAGATYGRSRVTTRPPSTRALREREHEAAGDQHSPVAAAIGDAARDDSDRDHNQRSRRDRETGLEKRVAPPLGKEEDEVEEHGGEGDREYERRQLRETVCVIRKEAEIHGGRSGVAGGRMKPANSKAPPMRLARVRG